MFARLLRPEFFLELLAPDFLELADVVGRDVHGNDGTLRDGAALGGRASVLRVLEGDAVDDSTFPRMVGRKGAVVKVSGSRFSEFLACRSAPQIAITVKTARTAAFLFAVHTANLNPAMTDTSPLSRIATRLADIRAGPRGGS